MKNNKIADIQPPENSSRFFENKACEYYPCHQGLEAINCLFCYCPFYIKDNCPGFPEFVEHNHKKIKSCVNCTFPHKPEHYDKIQDLLGKI